MSDEIYEGGSLDVNRVTMTGRVVSEPRNKDYSFREDNGARFTFRLENEDVAGRPQEFRVVMWGRKADWYFGRCRRGNLVLVTGRLKRNFHTSPDGVMHDDTEIEAGGVRILESAS